MARKKSDQLDKTKLDLGRTLLALDTRNVNYYENLTDEEKKKYVPLILMRFMSSGPNQEGLHEYFISSTNECVNLDFWILGKHPELLHKMLCVVGLGKKQYHQWIPMAKKQNTNKLFQFFYQIYPGINDIEFELLLKTNSEQDIENLCKDYALEDKETDDILKQFKNAKNDVSNDKN
jgi:hypothetical protein